MSNSTFLILKGQHPPFATITPTDHAAWIIISAAVGLSLTLLFAAIRIFIRSTTSKGYGLDDYLVATGTVLVAVQSILLLIACAKGLGKSIAILEHRVLVDVQKSYYASNLLCFPPLVLSKAAVICFLLRLTPVYNHRRIAFGVLGVLALWGIASVLAIAMTCNLSQPWISVDQKCSGYILRWQLIEAFGCLHEASVVAMAIWLVWGLQTSTDKKAIVVTAFGFRLGMIIIAGFRLGSFNLEGFTTDPTLLEARFIVWTSAELNYSLVSATIPLLRPLINNLSTNYGGGHSSSHDSDFMGSNQLHAEPLAEQINTFVLKSMPQTTDYHDGSLALEGNNHGSNYCGIKGGRQNTNESSNFSNLQIGRANASSIGSDASQKMLIEKHVTWRVEHGHRALRDS